jgi:hypothetical protein
MGRLQKTVIEFIRRPLAVRAIGCQYKDNQLVQRDRVHMAEDILKIRVIRAAAQAEGRSIRTESLPVRLLQLRQRPAGLRGGIAVRLGRRYTIFGPAGGEQKHNEKYA